MSDSYHVFEPAFLYFTAVYTSLLDAVGVDIDVGNDGFVKRRRGGAGVYPSDTKDVR